VAPVLSVELAASLDTHFDNWRTNHGTRLYEGMDALGRLLGYLKKTEDADGESFFARTTVLAFSEFSRTPLLNAYGGRDHHLASSALVSGPGLKPNQVIGATSNRGAMEFQRINLATGAVDPTGQTYRPTDVHATLLKSMGLAYPHLENQFPRILSALLR
jgi:uncharacterized protein (DUF1501 family)